MRSFYPKQRSKNHVDDPTLFVIYQQYTESQSHECSIQTAKLEINNIKYS